MARRPLRSQSPPARYASADLAGPRRPSPTRLVPAATFLLTSLTALVLLALALTLGGPLVLDAPPATPTTTGQSTLVHAFYAAVNTILAGGDGAALAASVAPDVVVHLPNQRIVGQAPLLAYWRVVGSTSPDLRLELDELIVDGDQIATTVEPLARTAALPMDIVAGPAAPQTVPDRFRLVHGRIAEYWSDLATDALPRALPPLPLNLWPGPKQAGLARFAFPPGATLADLVASDPHLLLPETGALTVTLVGQARLVRGDAVRAGWQPTGSRPLLLRPGDALLVPSGVTHSIHNATAAGASLFGVLLSGPDELAASPNYPTPDRLRRLLRLYATGLIDAPAARTGGVTMQLLAQGDDHGAAARATLTVRWLSLGPGQRLVPHAVAGVELLAMETGSALSGGAVPGHGTLIDPPARSEPAPDQAAVDGTAASRVVMAGDGLAASTGASPPIVNAGDAATQLLLVAVDPVPATAPTEEGACARASSTASCGR